jgi:hypothetical protein
MLLQRTSGDIEIQHVSSLLHKGVLHHLGAGTDDWWLLVVTLKVELALTEVLAQI